MKKSKQTTSEFKAQLARALADYDNLKKRAESERGNWEKVIVSSVALKLLPVLDIIINAQGHLNDAGLELAIREFKNTLSQMGVEEIPVTQGEGFDPLWQEAIQTVEGGEENDKDKVAEVVQSGWRIKDEGFVIRPAKVKVYGEVANGQEELVS